MIRKKKIIPNGYNFQEECLLYDCPTLGVAADIGHINTNSKVVGYQPGDEGLAACLKGTEVVVIPAGVPRKPGMTRDGTCDWLTSPRGESKYS